MEPPTTGSQKEMDCGALARFPDFQETLARRRLREQQETMAGLEATQRSRIPITILGRR